MTWEEFESYKEQFDGAFQTVSGNSPREKLTREKLLEVWNKLVAVAPPRPYKLNINDYLFHNDKLLLDKDTNTLHFSSIGAVTWFHSMWWDANRDEYWKACRMVLEMKYRKVVDELHNRLARDLERKTKIH